MRYINRLFFLVVATHLLFSGQSLAQYSQISLIDHGAWLKLAEQAERLTGSSTSERLLNELQYDLFKWQQSARSLQEQMAGEVEHLKSRLDYVNESIGSTDLSNTTIDTLRARISGNLNNAVTTLLLSEDIYQHAGTLISAIDEDLSSRKLIEFHSIEVSPLYPPAWIETSSFLANYLGEIIIEVRSASLFDARDNGLADRLPALIVTLAMGILLLTYARHWAARAFETIRIRLSLPHAGAVQELCSLVTDVILPTAGLVLVVMATGASGLLGLNGQQLAETVPWIGAIIFGVRWLATTLFTSDDNHDPILELPEDTRRTASRLVISLGWTMALERLARPLVEHGFSNLVTETVILYPFVIVASLLIIRLGRILVTGSSPGCDKDIHLGHRALYLLSRIAIVVAVACSVLATIGYIPATKVLVFSTISTLGIIAVGLTSYRTTIGFYDYLSMLLNNSSMQYWRGIVRIVFGLLLAIVVGTGFAISWGASRLDLLIFWEKMQEGISLGPINISVNSMGIMLVVFIAGLFLTRLVQTILAQTVLPNTHLDPGAQNSLNTGIGYAGVLISAFLAFSLAGFNLTNIALIAGALSVGIGFGLQAVVSNFVSGILLLMERPIREGDWIQTGSVSGTVKKISVRATHIQTFDRAMIVVPNSDLISGQVTNWTLDTRIGRIIIPVGVAYGTNVEQVLDILKGVVTECTSVTQDPEPGIAFMRFGADAMEFEIRAVLVDVNYMISARSEINQEIERRFAEAGISVPFAQRDLWIRNPEVLAGLRQELANDQNEPGTNTQSRLHRPSRDPNVSGESQHDNGPDV